MCLHSFMPIAIKAILGKYKSKHSSMSNFNPLSRPQMVLFTFGSAQKPPPHRKQKCVGNHIKSSSYPAHTHTRQSIATDSQSGGRAVKDKPKNNIRQQFSQRLLVKIQVDFTKMKRTGVERVEAVCLGGCFKGQGDRCRILG